MAVANARLQRVRMAEAAGVLKSGLESAAWITVDDTGARYKGMNGACTHIGNTDFAWFATTRAKSRLNFLALLRAGATDYVINDEALAYMRGRSLSGLVIARLAGHKSKRLKDQEAWMPISSASASPGSGCIPIR